MMDRPLTCDDVDQRELDRRYAAGTLPEEEASAFEAHFFGCDRCFALVKGGAAVRASVAPASHPASRPGRKVWRPLALAAGVVLALFGAWRAFRPGGAIPDTTVRGLGDSLVVRAAFDSAGLRLDWDPAPDGTSYRVRLYAIDGAVLLEQTVDTTALRITRDSLPAAAASGALDIEAFDALRRPVARSPLMPLPARPSP